jgi:hypothetical protein
MFNTEDYRSSFAINTKSGPSRRSQGPSGKSGGIQNKTSSSKNTNKKRRKDQSNDLRVSKRNNFLDEFDKFEEQFDQNLAPQKAKGKNVFVNQANTTKLSKDSEKDSKSN